jgi:hypothetical protein
MPHPTPPVALSTGGLGDGSDSEYESCSEGGDWPEDPWGVSHRLPHLTLELHPDVAINHPFLQVISRQTPLALITAPGTHCSLPPGRCNAAKLHPACLEIDAWRSHCWFQAPALS